MVGLVIASHGHLAEELVSTAAGIIGPLAKVATCSVAPGASADDVKQQIRDAVKAVDEGDGVIVFADLIGGSPCTQSLSLCQQSDLEVVTGVNLPMLLKAIAYRNKPLDELSAMLIEGAREAIRPADGEPDAGAAPAQHTSPDAQG